MDFQQLMLLGRATKDAEVLTSKDGKSYAKFSLAINEYRGKDVESKANFYDVLVFNKSVDRADQVKKGKLIMVQGKPDVDPYISKEGEAKASIVVFAEKWKAIG